MYHQINETKLRPISEAILKYLMDNVDPVDAERLWLDIKANGAPFSIGSVYSHLNKLVYAGLVVKVPGASNKKALYQYVSH
jgi:Fe2+ or Zn2+ uptake regulation protein